MINQHSNSCSNRSSSSSNNITTTSYCLVECKSFIISNALAAQMHEAEVAACTTVVSTNEEDFDNKQKEVENSLESFKKSFSCFEFESHNNDIDIKKLIEEANLSENHIMLDIDLKLASKKDIERYNILREILSSERKYLNDLQEIVKGYYEELLKSNLNDNNELVSHAFLNIKEITEFTNLFCEELQLCNCNAAEIANCFINKSESFYELYSAYCKNYQNAFTAAEKLEKIREVEKIIQRTKQQYGHNLKLATYLQLPVLHITKYHLLLQRYLKLTDADEDQKTYRFMFEALNVMKKVNDEINNNIADILPPVNRVLNTNDMKKLIDTYGDVLKEGDLFMVETKKIHYVILFESMFVIRKPLSSKVLYSIANESLAFLPKSFEFKNSDKYFTVIDYSQCKSHRMSQFTFKTRNAEEKHSWHSALLNSMLKGYGKKMPDNVKTRMMQKYDMSCDFNHPENNKNDTLKSKAYNYGRKSITDLRFNWKFDIRKAINNTIKNKSHKRRLSVPLKQVNGNVGAAKIDTNQTFVSRLSTISTVNLNNGTVVELEEHLTPPTMRTRRPCSLKRRNSSDCKTWCYDTHATHHDLEIIQEQEAQQPQQQQQQNRHSYQSSRTSEYECSEEQSSDTGVECLSLNTNSTFGLNDENSYLSTDNNNNNIVISEASKVSTPNNAYSDTVSSTSTSSLNSEEGYYSNHDSSLSTLIDENQARCSNKLQNSKRTLSYPEIANPTNFRILKMKEQCKLVPKAEIGEVNAESPQMNVKYLANVFDSSLSLNTVSSSIDNFQGQENEKVKTNLASCSSYYMQSNVSLNEKDKDENDLPPLNAAITAQRRSMSAYKINTSKNLDKNKLLQLRSNCLNSIRRTGSNSFRLERYRGDVQQRIVEENDTEVFLLREAFGFKLLHEAEHIFGNGIRELILKFEKNQK